MKNLSLQLSEDTGLLWRDKIINGYPGAIADGNSIMVIKTTRYVICNSWITYSGLTYRQIIHKIKSGLDISASEN